MNLLEQILTKAPADQIARATAIFVDDGCEFDATGDDYRAFYVTLGDDDGEPVSRWNEKFASWNGAMDYAEALSRETGLEVVAD